MVAVSVSEVRVGVLGCGHVGGALIELMAERRDSIAARTGLYLDVVRVAVRDLQRARPVPLRPGVLTRSAEEVVSDPEVDLVVEVMGGLEPARSLVLTALRGHKPVVTANKELLATSGAELFEAAAKAEVDLLFEAAVAGGIPLIRPLRESLAGEKVRRVVGIVNGTTNFVLTRMTDEGCSFGDALAEAQSLGYAEADPTADVEGLDAGAKAAIIASIAFGVRVVAGDVHCEGISGLTSDDIDFARRLGYVIKLVAIAEAFDDGEIAVRVHPVMVPAGHPLATVRDSFNAVFIEGEAVGELMLYGRGAGGRPTASAVLGDVVDAALNLRRGTGHAVHTVPGLRAARLRPMDRLSSQYYFTLEVVDRPGVLEKVAGVTARHGVSIKSMQQEGMGEEARLVLITHEAREADMQATLRDLRQLDAVEQVGNLVRVLEAG